ncbi:unnamed protein product [Urochloa humidicola]
MVTTNANKFGRFAVAVLEPEAIPTRLDVIIGNRYLQLLFELEPFQPNIGLSKKVNTNGNQDDKGNGEKKDTIMKENDNGGDGSAGKHLSGGNLHDMNGKSFSNQDVQEEEKMQLDWDQDDLLGEEHELSKAASTFLGIRKGEHLNVMRAAALASAHVQSPMVRITGQRPVVEPGVVEDLGHVETGSNVSFANQTDQQKDEDVLKKKVAVVPSKNATVQIQSVAKAPMASGTIIKNHATTETSKGKGTYQPNTNKRALLNRQSTNSEGDLKKQTKAQHKGMIDTAAGNDTPDLGGLLDTMLRAGVAANGASNGSTELGSKTVMAALSPGSDGHLTPFRRSLRTAGDADVDSVEKAGIRVAIKNLEEPQGTLQRNTLDTFLVIATESGRSPCSEYGLQDA